jgi:hypothetical protein
MSLPLTIAWQPLLEAAALAALAALAASLLISLTILLATRSAELRRDGRDPAALAHAVLAGLTCALLLAGTVGAVVLVALS